MSEPRRYFLREAERQLYEGRAQRSYVSEPQRDGHFRLFNKNNWTTLHVRVVERAVDRHGWIVTVAGEVPEYFRTVLQPEASADV